MIESMGSQSQIMVITMIALPLAAGLVLKGVVSKLWAMMNTFQLINEISILPISIPSNVSNVQKETISMINFNPIPKEMVYSMFFGNDEEEYPVGEEINYPKSLRMLEDDNMADEPLSASEIYSSL